MKTRTQILALAVVAGLATIVNGATVPPALPGGASNMFSGNFANGYNGTWNGQNVGPGIVTDSDLDTVANSTYEASGPATLDVRAAVFATPSSSPVSAGSNLGTMGPITLIRLWGQPAFLNGGNFNDAYTEPPAQVSVKYGYANSENPQNAYSITGGSFDTTATILAVNGNAPTYLDPGPNTTVSLTPSIWQQNGPVADNVGNPKQAYYVDLTVSIPSTNGVFFDFGTQPARQTNGYGGLYVNEIQAAAVPEPVATGLLATAGAGLLIRRRRA